MALATHFLHLRESKMIKNGENENTFRLSYRRQFVG